MPNLTDKVAVITGGGRGIGRSIAIAYARAGAGVAICSPTRSELDEVADLALYMATRPRGAPNGQVYSLNAQTDLRPLARTPNSVDSGRSIGV